MDYEQTVERRKEKRERAKGLITLLILKKEKLKKVVLKKKNK